MTNELKPIEYRAPLGGYYSVASKIAKVIPTGNMIEVPNPKYCWYKPWQPKTVLQKEYRTEEVYEGRETVFLKEGQSISTLIGTYRIGS
jgi:hypothetical protein